MPHFYASKATKPWAINDALYKRQSPPDILIKPSRQKNIFCVLLLCSLTLNVDLNGNNLLSLCIYWWFLLFAFFKLHRHLF